MTATKVQPFKMLKILTELFFHSLKGFCQRLRPLLTQGVKMKATNPIKEILLWGFLQSLLQFTELGAQTAITGAWIVNGMLLRLGGMLRINP